MLFNIIVFAEWLLAASRDASSPKNWPAVLPQAPNVSTTNGTHFHPISEQIVSLDICFLSSVCLAAAPATTPTSDKMFDLSGEVMDTSMAAGLSLLDQLGMSMSAGLVSLLSWPKPAPASNFGFRRARLQKSKIALHRALWRATTSPPNLQVTAWCASRALSGQ